MHRVALSHTPDPVYYKKRERNLRHKEVALEEQILFFYELDEREQHLGTILPLNHKGEGVLELEDLQELKIMNTPPPPTHTQHTHTQTHTHLNIYS